MFLRLRFPSTLALVLGGLLAFPSAGLLFAGTPKAKPTRDDATASPDALAKSAPVTTTEDDESLPSIDVLEGLRTGQLKADAEGRGDGKISLAVTNRTNRKLRVVLPPGLIASGATGQFGGMGGMMGGGMGGMMGGMGGGMGGMMGGMGGGMGGMGGGMGGRGGGMRGGMGGGMRGGMGGGTMPAMMGMMMLGRLIMNLCGEKDSWDQRSLMSGMMMMGGRGMMGGMGGGMMGGMGGMMGGMGGGMRSVPPTGLPEAVLNPHQTRHLPTVVVGLAGPNGEAQVEMPAKGEKLAIGGVDQVTNDPRTKAALKRLARDKAPQTVSQLVLWNVATGLDWGSITRLSQEWANPNELALARAFVARLDESGGRLPKADSGVLYWDVKTSGATAEALAADLRTFWEKAPVLGLALKEGVPEAPDSPALAFRLKIEETKATVQVATSTAACDDWQALGSFELKIPGTVKLDDPKAEAKLDAKQKEKLRAAVLGDALAEGLLNRLIHAQLSKGPRVNGHPSFKVKIINASPLILNGVALAGPDASAHQPPTALAGMSLPPHKNLTVPATAEMVQRLNLKEGLHVVAADLSGL